MIKLLGKDKGRGSLMLGAVLVVAGQSLAQIPPGFELVRLTNDPNMGNSIPDINNLSEVVWSDIVVPNLAQMMIFSRGIIRSISETRSYDLRQAINDNSQRVWYACESDLGPFSVVADYVEESVFGPADLANGPGINNQGDIIWETGGAGTFDIWLYTHRDGLVLPITSGGNNQGGRINDNGHIVWRTQDNASNPDTASVFMYSSGVVSEVNPNCQYCQEPDINNMGHVVWTEFDEFLVFWNGQSMATIDSIASTPRMNNVDEIAFAKWFPDEQLWKHAIYKADSLIYVLPNFGMSTARLAINDRGEVVMRSRNLQTGDSELFLLRRLAPKGDFDHDCHLDLWDRAIFESCFTGAAAGPSGGLLADCSRADFDEDGDVDLEDLQALEVTTGGPDAVAKGCVE